jgi:hypothetical protein
VGVAGAGGGTILDAIGDTPLVMVEGIWVKLEYSCCLAGVIADRMLAARRDATGGA